VAREAVADAIFSLAKRRGFFWPSNEIYGGVAGFYDYGPLGTRLKQNIVDVWRRMYVIEEGCAEIDCPNVSPEAVFQASGHLGEFSDLLVSCKECGGAFRADQFIEEEAKKALDKAGPDGEEAAELNGLLASVNELVKDPRAISDAIERHGFKCQRCGGALSEPEPFNLMFKTNIGPGSARDGYLRPETAQAMFTNFSLLYKYFREALPFGIVQVGKGFRNEISPRQGLIRQREFFMMEAEVFFDPEDKGWPRFDGMKDEALPLLIDGEMKNVTCGECVENGVLSSQAIAYFMGLTKRFLVEVGIDPARLRFRRHGDQEMAHYANDCWDAEIETSLGWIEAVGIADRGNYDLGRHIQHSGQELKGFKRYAEPKEVERLVIKPDFSKLGPMFKKDAGKVKAALESLELDAEPDGPLVIQIDGNDIEIPADCFSVSLERVKQTGSKFIPHVIEPSYGLDRIFYSVMEHAYGKREDFTVMKFRPGVAPVQAGVFPLMSKDGLDTLAREVEAELKAAGIYTHYDGGGSIGRRYARMDEVGTPYCVTVDYDSLKDGCVTIRDRDTTGQERVKITELAGELRKRLG